MVIIFSPSDAITWSSSVKTRSDSAHWCPHFLGTPHLKIRWVTVVSPVTWGGIIRPTTTGHGINAANSTFAWNCCCTCIHQHVPSCLQSGAGESAFCGCKSNNGNVQGGVWPGQVTYKSVADPCFGSAEQLGVFLHCLLGVLVHHRVTLYIWVRCLAQEHNSVTLARAWTRNTRSGEWCISMEY